MIMNVMFTPATANGYSHAERFPPCLLRSFWKEAWKSNNTNYTYKMATIEHTCTEKVKQEFGLTLKVFAKKRRFSNEMNPAPLLNKQINWVWWQTEIRLMKLLITGSQLMGPCLAIPFVSTDQISDRWVLDLGM